eukprot:1019608-Heterocapsa_arctica.AAC.1
MQPHGAHPIEAASLTTITYSSSKLFQKCGDAVPCRQADSLDRTHFGPRPACAGSGQRRVAP